MDIKSVYDREFARNGRVCEGYPLDGLLTAVYATTLHYAPCHTDPAKGFRVAVVLPRGTNGPRPEFEPATEEDRLLWARNKWLLAHADSAEARQGAVVGLTGENIDIT